MIISADGLDAFMTILNFHNEKLQTTFFSAFPSEHAFCFLTMTTEKVSEKTSFQVGMELKKVEKQDGDEKASRTLRKPCILGDRFLAVALQS